MREGHSDIDSYSLNSNDTGHGEKVKTAHCYGRHDYLVAIEDHRLQQEALLGLGLAAGLSPLCSWRQTLPLPAGLLGYAQSRLQQPPSVLQMPAAWQTITARAKQGRTMSIDRACQGWAVGNGRKGQELPLTHGKQAPSCPGQLRAALCW